MLVEAIVRASPTKASDWITVSPTSLMVFSTSPKPVCAVCIVVFVCSNVALVVFRPSTASANVSFAATPMPFIAWVPIMIPAMAKTTPMTPTTSRAIPTMRLIIFCTPLSVEDSRQRPGLADGGCEAKPIHVYYQFSSLKSRRCFTSFVDNQVRGNAPTRRMVLQR